MPEPALPPLHEWESFYVIVGSSAAALTGLMFVVVALGAERLATRIAALRAFGSPTVLHFCTVLLVAGIIATPRQTIPSLRLCLTATGLGGLLVSGWVLVHAKRQRGYKVVASDWVWHLALPTVSYAAILFAAIALARRPEAALYVVGAAALVLLFIGIHNAWDSAVFIAVERSGREEPAIAGGAAPPGVPSEPRVGRKSRTRS